MSDYILTYSKIKFYPLEPVKEDIKIEDIAHSLSLMTRANGHCRHFYSVAQHSIHCFQEAKARRYSERVQLGCLLHDASESYISDLTRPVKRNMPEYFVIEERLQRLIYERFDLGNLTEDELKRISEVDDALLYNEFEELMDHHLFDMPPKLATKHDFSQKDFVNVEREFLANFFSITKESPGYRCVGIDGCKVGWVAVGITDTGFDIEILNNIASIVDSNFDSILIDMPIGLPESTSDIRPDGAVRKLLKGKASSIFNTPCRQAVYAETYEEANKINRQIMGKGLSKQSYAICGKIREIDEFLKRYPKYKNKLLESHPELCFAKLNEGEPIYENKHTFEGTRRRIELLSRYYDKTDDVITNAVSNPRLKNCLDDVIDALCLAVTGMIGLNNRLKSIPETPGFDKVSLLMQIVYADK